MSSRQRLSNAGESVTYMAGFLAMLVCRRKGMSRKRNKIDGGYVIIPKNTLKCNQWKKLNISTKIAYVTILTEFIRDKKLNPEHLVKITHAQIEAKSGISHSSVIRSMRELKEDGFLEVVVQGGLERRNSVYKLSTRYLY